jgi:hypothetical protein
MNIKEVKLKKKKKIFLFFFVFFYSEEIKKNRIFGKIIPLSPDLHLLNF